MKKKVIYAIIAVLLILIITNPSQKAFKEYIGANSYLGLKRKTNFFICSIYLHNGITYLAILENFIKITPKTWQPPQKDILYRDSIVSADSVILADSGKSNHYDTVGHLGDLPILKLKK